MRIRLLLSAVTVFVFQACSGDPVDDASKAIKPEQAVCLASLTEVGKAQLAIKDCEVACLDGDKPDRVACGALALAHLQSFIDEVAGYVNLVKPLQSPGEMAVQMQNELTSRYEPQIDLRALINQFLRGMIDDLRGISKGVYHAVGGGETVNIPIEELPLNASLLSAIYGRAESFTLKGAWTDRELILLGAAANGLLSAVDFIMAHNLNVNASDVPDLNGIGEILSFGIQLLDDEKNLLSVDAPKSMTDSRNEFHAAVSLLAGREATKENVAQSGPGFLALIKESFEQQISGANAVDSPSFLKLTDVDGDGELSKGDNMVVVLKVNGEEVTFGFIYIFSAVFTRDVFQLITDISTNLDGSKSPAHIAAVYNSFLLELGVFRSAVPVQLDPMPDVIALDFDTFFTEFKGLRHLLPYWYEDKSTGSGVNPMYLKDVTAGTVKYFFAYEREPEIDASHFDWVNDANVDWMGFATPAGFAEDGLELDEGQYLLFQDPDFAGLLHVNTTPFESNSYHLKPEITTGGEFMPSKNNQMTNALINAMIIWATE